MMASNPTMKEHPELYLRNRANRLLKLLLIENAPPQIIATECRLIADAAAAYREKHKERIEEYEREVNKQSGH